MWNNLGWVKDKHLCCFKKLFTPCVIYPITIACGVCASVSIFINAYWDILEIRPIAGRHRGSDCTLGDDVTALSVSCLHPPSCVSIVIGTEMGQCVIEGDHNDYYKMLSNVLSCGDLLYSPWNQNRLWYHPCLDKLGNIVKFSRYKILKWKQ